MAEISKELNALITESSDGRDRSGIVLADASLVVRERLKDLRKWQKDWEEKDRVLAQIVDKVNPRNKIEVRKSAEIASLRRRLRSYLVKEPFEFSEELVQGESYSRLREKLVEQYVGLKAQEKLFWLYNLLLIITPDLRSVISKIQDVRSYRPFGQQPNLLVGGESGMGKTTILNWLASLFPVKIESDINFAPIVKFDAPTNNRTTIPLSQRIIRAMGKTSEDWSDEDLLNLVIHFLQLCKVEVVIVDEVEHLNKHALKRRLLEISNLTNENLSIVCASCHPKQWTLGDPQIEGRWEPLADLPPYTGEGLTQLLRFIELLLPFTQDSFLSTYQFNPGSKRSEVLRGPAQLIEMWTGGILQKIMLLIVRASVRAIMEGLPNLPPSLLLETWNKYQTDPEKDPLRVLQHAANQTSA